MGSSIDKVIEANELIDNLKAAILGNVIVTIRDTETNEIVWSCHSDKFYGVLKKWETKFEVEQDINLDAVLKEMKKFL